MMYQSLIFQRSLAQPQQQAAFFIRGECTGKRFDRQLSESRDAFVHAINAEPVSLTDQRSHPQNVIECTNLPDLQPKNLS